MIVEVAAMNQREKNLGYNAAKVMTDNIFRQAAGREPDNSSTPSQVDEGEQL